MFLSTGTGRIVEIERPTHELRAERLWKGNRAVRRRKEIKNVACCYGHIKLKQSILLIRIECVALKTVFRSMEPHHVLGAAVSRQHAKKLRQIRLPLEMLPACLHPLDVY